MSYALAMRTKILFISSGILFLSVAVLRLSADEVDMQNGDRYFGKVLSVSADVVVLQSEVLGKINVPRKNVASLAFGTNAVTAISVATNPPAALSAPAMTDTNSDFSTALRVSGADTNAIQSIREQMLAASPEAAGKYDEMVNGLLSGQLNVDDLRREAQSDADQLRALKRELGPDAGESLDGYLDVLDDFLKESNSAAGSTNAATVSPPKAQLH
jgi:hypothetical protein